MYEDFVALLRRCELRDVVLITGRSIANGTIDHLLELTTKAREVAIIGASAGILRGVLFKRGVTILGGVKIMDAAKMMQVVSEGAEPQPSN